MTLPFAHTLVPTLILLAGVANDLWSRKVKNMLVLACMAIALLSAYFTGGWAQVGDGGLALLLALVLTLPLVLFGVIGAGDMKIFMAFGLASESRAIVPVTLAALIWGALLGVCRSIVQGEALTLLRNTAGIVYSPWRTQAIEYHKIPYTIALFLGWTTFLVLETYGVGL